jgi:hypothetical protein
MKQVAMFWMLLLLVGSIGLTQVGRADEGTAADQPDSPVDTATNETWQSSPLEELGWLVGEWVDEGENSKITTTCSWKMNQKFLARSLRVTIDDQTTLTGNQVIGWDPIAGQIRSWTFDSEGGIGKGRWIRDGNRWLVKKSFVLASGKRASAINVITYVDQDTLRWQSTNREVGGELLPNIPEVTVVRQKREDTGSNPGDKKEVSS